MVRIPVDKSYMRDAISRLNQAKTPPHLRTHTRKLQSDIAVADTATISRAKPKEIKLHLETPSAELYSPSFEQCRGTSLGDLSCLATNPELAKLFTAAGDEQAALGVG